MISIISIIGAAVSALLAIGVPLLLLILLKKKTQKGLLAAATGAVCFVVFALILEQLLHLAVLPHIAGNTLLYCLYGCLAAGVFEETARLVGLFFLCRKDKSLSVGLGYGVGHGGIEAILLGGIMMVSNLVLMLLDALGVANTGIAAQMVEVLRATQPLLFWLGGIERCIALAAQIALSILVWMVVTKRVPLWYFPVAIGLHAALDIPAALGQTGVLKNIVAIEVLIFLLAVILCIYVKLIYNNAKTRQALAALSAEDAAQIKEEASADTISAPQASEEAIADDDAAVHTDDGQSPLLEDEDACAKR